MALVSNPSQSVKDRENMNTRNRMIRKSRWLAINVQRNWFRVGEGVRALWLSPGNALMLHLKCVAGWQERTSNWKVIWLGAELKCLSVRLSIVQCISFANSSLCFLECQPSTRATTEWDQCTVRRFQRNSDIGSISNFVSVWAPQPFICHLPIGIYIPYHCGESPWKLQL